MTTPTQPDQTAVEKTPNPPMAPYNMTQIAGVIDWTHHLEKKPEDLNNGFLFDVRNIAGMLLRGDKPPAAVHHKNPYPWNKRAQPPAPAPEIAPMPEVHVSRMLESSGKVTWFLQLRRTGTDFVNESLDVYSSLSEGRVRYHAAEYEHLFGRGPKPDILAFDDSIPEDQKKFAVNSAVTALQARVAELEKGNTTLRDAGLTLVNYAESNEQHGDGTNGENEGCEVCSAIATFKATPQEPAP